MPPLTSTPGLSWIDHLVILAYFGVLLAMGVTIGRRQRSTDDFFVAGRRLPAWAVGISLLASIFSTIAFLGTPGEMFRTGIGFLMREASIPLVLVVVWFLWIPFFMRLKLTSAYEYLEFRFNYPTRALAAVFCLLLLFGWVAVVVLTASKAMVEITMFDVPWFFGRNSADYSDADVHLFILSIGLFSVVYTTMGGIRVVVWTDVLQFFILIGGAVATMVTVAWITDSGFSDWFEVSQAYKFEKLEWFSWDVGDRSTVAFVMTGMFFWYICTHGANQITLQRYFTVRDVWAARCSYLVSALAKIVLALVLGGVGIALMYFVQHYEIPAAAALESDDARLRVDAQDAIFPQFIGHYLPRGIRGLVVAALFAAAMSTIDSGANSAATIMTVDFFRRGSKGAIAPSRRGAGANRLAQQTGSEKIVAERAELRLARILTATSGLVVIAATFCLYHMSKGTDIITLCQKGFNLFLGPLGGLFVLAMFCRWATAHAVIPAVLLGEVVGVCAAYSQQLFGRPFSTFLVIGASWLATLVAGYALALLLWLVCGIQASAAQRQWMWWPVVSRPLVEEPPPDVP